jgi:hypothetical protein
MLEAQKAFAVRSAGMRVRELITRTQRFHNELEAHFDLWSHSLEQPIPDYPVRNIEVLREQMGSLARQLGTLRPYIERFTPSTLMSVMGQTWDAYNSAVSNDVSVRKGPSIEAILPLLQQMLGRLEAMNPDDEIPVDPRDGEERSGTVNIYNLHGSHSRVNIQSEDRSVNVSSISEKQVFTGIRKAITEGLTNEDEKAIVLEKLSALEKSIHSTDFILNYQAFINAVASHMTIILPFIPALAQMLGH